MRELVQDTRFGLRLLGSNPGFTVAAVLCLALGIGGNSAIFSVLNRIALQPLPYGTDENLITLQTTFPGVELERSGLSEAELDDVRTGLRTVEPVVAYVPIDANLEFGAGDEPARVVTIVGDTGLFRALGVTPALGVGFVDRHGIYGNHLVVVLSHHIWQREYGGDPDVIGRTVVLDAEEHEIIGVMPPGFRFPFVPDAEMFAPLALMPNSDNPRENRYLSAFARLRPDVDIDDTRHELDTLAVALAREHRDVYPERARFRFVATSARDVLFASVRPAVLALMFAVGAVLLIVCANVASLLLVRGTTRAGELALRSAIGAPRARLIRQLLAESLVLALLGAGGGLLLALWGIDLLVALGPDALPHLRTVSLDGTVLLFTVGCAVVTGLVFGVIPALQASRPDLTRVLNASTASTVGGGRATEAGSSHRVRNALLAAEIALALLLLVAAGLSLKSLHAAERADLGFRADRVMAMSLKLAHARYPANRPERRLLFYAELFEMARERDNPIELAAVSELPLSGNDTEYSCEAEGVPKAIEVRARIVTPGYFDVMGIPVRRGRVFRADEARPGYSVVIDEVLARRHFGTIDDAVGKRIRLTDRSWAPVIGVVGAVRHNGVAEQAPPHIYTVYMPRPPLRMTLVAEVDRPPAEIARAVREAVRALDPELAVYDVKTMNERVYESLALYRFSTLLLAVFAGLALLLAVIGVYAVMAFTLAQRRREMAVRLVLGASPRQLVAMLVRRGLRTAGIGVAIGLALSPLVGASLSTWLVESRWFDPIVVLASAAGVFMASSIACVVAARHVADIDPVLALRTK